MEAVGLLSQTGKGNLGMLPSGGGYTNQLLEAGGQVGTYHNIKPVV